jgi:hypothetical protein
MVNQICVVQEKGATFFRHNNLLFDTLSAQILSWEDDQDSDVYDKDGQKKATIKFFDGGLETRQWLFEYRGTRCESLHAFQFDVGDTFVLVFRDGEDVAELETRLRHAHIRYYTAIQTKYADAAINPKAAKQIFAKKAADDLRKNPNGPLRFRHEAVPLR